MKQFGAACCLLAMCAAPAFAGDLPARKTGLWQIQTTILPSHTMSMQQCIDPKTDAIMQSRFSSLPQQNCSKHDVQKAADKITIDSVCSIAGRTTSSHIVVTGSFDSAYTMVMTSEVKGLAAPHTITMTAKWLGPCAAGQKPGDMVLPNGKTVNVIDMERAVRGAFRGAH
jgi:Protein of unknown function (DUF3617)